MGDGDRRLPASQGGRQELTLESCTLTSTCTLWHSQCVSKHTERIFKSVLQEIDLPFKQFMERNYCLEGVEGERFPVCHESPLKAIGKTDKQSHNVSHTKNLQTLLTSFGLMYRGSLQYTSRGSFQFRNRAQRVRTRLLSCGGKNIIG